MKKDVGCYPLPRAGVNVTAPVSQIRIAKVGDAMERIVTLSRRYNFKDRLVVGLDQAMRTVFGGTAPGRENPALRVEEGDLSVSERRAAVGLMRVNHAGEVAAQALYQGQSVTARGTQVKRVMEQAAQEENDHLVWCRARLKELNGSTSLLDPFWYAGAFTIGTVAGLLGDKANLGFLAETERQVVEHLDGHLERLPGKDERSRAIVKQMRDDELSHARTAVEQGALEFTRPVKSLMRFGARVMTRSAYWI